jgi:hypothetical protein
MSLHYSLNFLTLDCLYFNFFIIKVIFLFCWTVFNFLKILFFFTNCLTHVVHLYFAINFIILLEYSHFDFINQSNLIIIYQFNYCLYSYFIITFIIIWVFFQYLESKNLNAKSFVYFQFFIILYVVNRCKFRCFFE